MTATELAAADRSVVVAIDLQGKLMELVHRPRLVIDATRRLLELADLFQVPVVLTEQYPRGLGPTVPEIRAAFDALAAPKSVVEKTSFGCSGEPGFDAAVAALRPGVPFERLQFVIAGIEAHVCVMQTVLELRRRGGHVHLCHECVSGRGEEYRRHALERMQLAGAILTNHESVAFEWARGKDHPAFGAMNRLLRGGQIA